MLRGRLLACAAGAAALITAAPAGAATLNVNTGADEANAGDGACSLREAIAAVDSPGSANGDCAAAAFGANTIVLGAQPYFLGGGFPAQHNELVVAPTVTSLTITGAGASKTTIDATTLGNRVLEISPGANVTLANLTIARGHAADGTGGGAGQSGGAILNGGILQVSDAAVTSSKAGNGDAGRPGGAGGGIFNTGTLTLDGVTIAGNSAGTGGAGSSGATGGDGGGGGIGGGVANAGGIVTVTASTIRGNASGDGGAGGSGGTGAGGASGGAGDGGGIMSQGGTLAVTNSTFASNVTGHGGVGGAGGPASGGGIGGHGGNGGAVAATAAAIASLQSVTVAGNSAGAGGDGGTGVPDGAAGAAGSPGGVFSAGVTTPLQNSLLASNSGGNCGGAIADAGHNLSFAGAGCPTTFLIGDPNLGALQDNGGPTQTISLASGSAAIDKVPATGAACQQTDQRGVPRPSGPACDIGAYEVATPKATTGAAAPIGLASATVTGSVTPNAGDATVQFEFGTTTKYGTKTAVQHLSGVSPTPVAVTLSRLKVKTTYHFRLIVSTMDGSAQGVDHTFRTSPKPIIGKFSIKPTRFRAGGKAATITYTDTQASRVMFAVLHSGTGVKRGRRCVAPPRHGGSGGKCTRLVTIGTFTRTDKVGMNAVRFAGRLGGRKLAPGVYTLQLTPRANRQFGRSVKLTFRIAP